MSKFPPPGYAVWLGKLSAKLPEQEGEEFVKLMLRALRMGREASAVRQSAWGIYYRFVPRGRARERR